MKGLVVADSTCLIGLERIGRLDLLPALFDPIVIPPEVEREFGGLFAWLKVESPANQALIASLKMLVDDGEAEAIGLAYEKGCRLILDDRHARSVARGLGLTMMGTVGILVKAKREGIITYLKPLLDDLAVNSFHLSEALREEALRLAGE